MKFFWVLSPTKSQSRLHGYMWLLPWLKLPLWMAQEKTFICTYLNQPLHRWLSIKYTSPTPYTTQPQLHIDMACVLTLYTHLKKTGQTDSPVSTSYRTPQLDDHIYTTQHCTIYIISHYIQPITYKVKFWLISIHCLLYLEYHWLWYTILLSIYYHS